MSHQFRKAPFAILVFSALCFGINTFNIFSLFHLISEEFDEHVSLLGIIAASTFLGIGLIQIPSGILAAKVGPKMTATLGMAVIFSAAITIGLSTDVLHIIILRFILGAGAALFFPSAIVLGAENFRKGSEGLGTGTIVGSYLAGGVLGLVVWAILAESLGWRISIIMGAVLAVVAAACIYFLVPRLARAEFKIRPAHIRSLLADKTLVIIGLVLLGSQAAAEQTLAFMPFYLADALTVNPALAGLIASFVLIAALIGSPAVGWLYDRMKNHFKLVMMLACVSLVGVSINYLQTLSAAIISALAVGFVGGGFFALLSNAARERTAAGKAEHRAEYTTLSVNWVHAIALTGTFWVPIVFSSSVVHYGYSSSWPVLGAISFGIVVTFAILGRKALFVGVR